MSISQLVASFNQCNPALTHSPLASLQYEAPYESHPAVKTQNPGALEIVYRAKFTPGMCGWCDSSKDRTHYWVTENGIMWNWPAGCFCIPPNICCKGDDMVGGYHFDRGVFDRQNIYFQCGFYGGPIEVFEGEIQVTLGAGDGWVVSSMLSRACVTHLLLLSSLTTLYLLSLSLLPTHPRVHLSTSVVALTALHAITNYKLATSRPSAASACASAPSPRTAGAAPTR